MVLEIGNGECEAIPIRFKDMAGITQDHWSLSGGKEISGAGIKRLVFNIYFYPPILGLHIIL